MTAIGHEMHGWARDLFPLPRSLTGDGVRGTLQYLKGIQPDLQIHEIESGSAAFDWIVPKEWNLRRAWIEDPSGRVVVDSDEHNLHVVGYSTPVDVRMDLEELLDHVYSLPDQADAIPYVTSYYAERWGFCMSHAQVQALEPGTYRAVVDADLEPGSLTYADLVIPGDTDREVLFSTYVCHPMMANNELSGPVVATALARHIAALPKRRNTYRFVFVPETIGALVYTSRHLDRLKQHVDAGFVITCVGDERAWSYLPSRAGDTLADRVAKHVLAHSVEEYDAYSFLDRGSDERQYCAPGIDLPVASVMRSKYGTYPEYHTSLDDLNLVTPSGLEASFDVYARIINAIEVNATFVATKLGEPHLGRRGLYPTTSKRGSAHAVRTMMNLLAYSDGDRDLLGIADLLGVPVGQLAVMADSLESHDLLRRLN